jgi:hypothetical protein
MNRNAVIALLVAAPLVAAPAQWVSATLDAGGTSLRYADTVSATGLTVAPALLYASGLSTVGLSATLSKFAAGTSTQGMLFGSTFTPTFHLLSGEFGGSAGGSAHEDGSRTGVGSAFARAHLMGARAGGWAGAGLGGTWDGTTWRGVRQSEGGGWASFATAGTVVGTVTPTTVGDTIRYADAELALRWKFAKTEIGATAGIRNGTGLPALPGAKSGWGGLSVTTWITPNTAFVASAGTYPLDFSQGFPAGKYVTVSMRISSAKHQSALGQPSVLTPEPSGPISDFTTSRAGAQLVFRVRAPSARSLDMMGDFTQWSPVAMHAEGNGWWMATISVAPGTYQMNVRIDGGGWVVPPGLTAIKDEAGGEVGILIVPNR